MRGALAGLLFLTACSPAAPVETTSEPPSSTIQAPTTTTTIPADDPVLSDKAAEYLDAALAAMRQHSINRDVVDWAEIESRAYQAADGATQPADTYNAIRVALSDLKDRHSIFLTPADAGSFRGTAQFEEPVVERRDDGIGYIQFGGYMGDIGAQADAYATDLAARISAIAPESCGWIVDLRRNSGGNMWPMIAGLVPVLGTGAVGSFVYPDGRDEPWELADGVAWWDGSPMVSYGVDAEGSETRPTGVLIGGATASSGEAVTVAFHGADEVRMFGYPTEGLTTANEPVDLADGAILILTMSVFTDRNGVEFGINLPVEPDETVGEFRSASGHEVIDRAAEWLLAHPDCASA